MRKHGKDRLAGGARLFRCSAAQSRKLDRNTCGTAVMLRSLVIAGEQEGRVVNAIEIEPAYVDVTVRRWEDFTGRKATKTKGA